MGISQSFINEQIYQLSIIFQKNRTILLIKTALKDMGRTDMNILGENRRYSFINRNVPIVSEDDEGMDRPVSQGGSNVSGGQKQRLAIARAIAKKPDLLVFDDSFSALDMKTDVALRRALAENTAESTRIIVAQRVGTILHAEQIIVLDEGKIAGKGTHKELMETCRIYRETAISQLSEAALAQ